MSISYTTLQIDVKGPIFDFLDISSMRAMRLTSTHDRMLVESRPKFPEADKKAMRAIREYLEIKAAHQKTPKFQVRFAHFWDGYPPLTTLFRKLFSCVNNVLDLEKAKLEIAKDISVSQFFGTRQEFASIIEFHFPPDSVTIDYKTLPSSIVRCSLPVPRAEAEADPDGNYPTLTSRPALIIRLQRSEGEDLQVRVVSLVFHSCLNTWCFYERLPENSITERRENYNYQPLVDKDGRKTASQTVVRKLLFDKEYTFQDGHTYKVQ